MKSVEEISDGWYFLIFLFGQRKKTETTKQTKCWPLKYLQLRAFITFKPNFCSIKVIYFKIICKLMIIKIYIYSYAKIIKSTLICICKYYRRYFVDLFFGIGSSLFFLAILEQYPFFLYFWSCYLYPFPLIYIHIYRYG